MTSVTPSGRVLETHPIPAIRPTNCCFGGADFTEADYDRPIFIDNVPAVSDILVQNIEGNGGNDYFTVGADDKPDTTGTAEGR